MARFVFVTWNGGGNQPPENAVLVRQVPHGEILPGAAVMVSRGAMIGSSRPPGAARLHG